MKKQPPGIETGESTITVLSVSSYQDDHESFGRLLCSPKWNLRTASSILSATVLLRQAVIPLVVCDRDLPVTWQDMYNSLKVLPRQPYLIVASWLADDHLWAETLKIGAYDVLAKPLDTEETIRILSLAWLHWQGSSHRSWAATGT